MLQSPNSIPISAQVESFASGRLISRGQRLCVTVARSRAHASAGTDSTLCIWQCFHFRSQPMPLFFHSPKETQQALLIGLIQLSVAPKTCLEQKETLQLDFAVSSGLMFSRSRLVIPFFCMIDLLYETSTFIWHCRWDDAPPSISSDPCSWQWKHHRSFRPQPSGAAHNLQLLQRWCTWNLCCTSLKLAKIAQPARVVHLSWLRGETLSYNELLAMNVKSTSICRLAKHSTMQILRLSVQ